MTPLQNMADYFILAHTESEAFAKYVYLIFFWSISLIVGAHTY